MIVHGPEVVEWVSRHSEGSGRFDNAQGIGRVVDGQLVGGAVFNDYTGPNICMHVASDGSRRWINRELLRVCFDYPFNQLGVDRITGIVGEGNEDARRFDENLGFELEARLKGAHKTGDLLVYVLWRDKCRFLRGRYVET